jgi:hypothetical protein
MKTFTDADGREWKLRLTLGVIEDVRDTLDVDLLQPEDGDPPLLTRLGTDERLMAEVICCILADQFEANKVDAKSIKRAFDGTTLLAAQTAFYDELVLFFQNRGRPDRAAAAAKQKELIEVAVAKINEKINAVNPTELIDGALSGDSQDSSVSIPES